MPLIFVALWADECMFFPAGRASTDIVIVLERFNYSIVLGAGW